METFLEKFENVRGRGLQGRKVRLICLSHSRPAGEEIFDNMVGDPEK